jgi:hypothetical protein
MISQQDGEGRLLYSRTVTGRCADYGAADTSINCGATPCLNGNGNGLIEATASGSVAHEEILVWNHLTAAGFLNGSYAMANA